MLSITTDYARDRGHPENDLQRIARAGFSHVHWCHHWNTDFLYGPAELEQIAAWLAELGLCALDLHGSAGLEKNWTSPMEYQRRAGVELVANRLEMTARLGGNVVVMHGGWWEALRRSLDDLAPRARDLGVRIAIENGDWALIGQALEAYPPELLGVCYDCGHGNIPGDGLDQLERHKDRLIAIHLHDNDGTADQHRLPFTGTVDWARLMGIIARSSYGGCISLEVSMRNEGIADEDEFLARAFGIGTQLSEMLAQARASAIA